MLRNLSILCNQFRQTVYPRCDWQYLTFYQFNRNSLTIDRYATSISFWFSFDFFLSSFCCCCCCCQKKEERKSEKYGLMFVTIKLKLSNDCIEMTEWHIENRVYNNYYMHDVQYSVICIQKALPINWYIHGTYIFIYQTYRFALIYTVLHCKFDFMQSKQINANVNIGT